MKYLFPKIKQPNNKTDTFKDHGVQIVGFAKTTKLSPDTTVEDVADVDEAATLLEPPLA